MQNFIDEFLKQARAVLSAPFPLFTLSSEVIGADSNKLNTLVNISHTQALTTPPQFCPFVSLCLTLPHQDGSRLTTPQAFAFFSC